MEQSYLEVSKILKAISNPKRLCIVDMLSCGEMGATEILEEFQISQSTLSYDMKLLVDTGIVVDRWDGKNVYYTLNKKVFEKLCQQLMVLSSSKEVCICHNKDACTTPSVSFGLECRKT